ncbi:hypothetical protein [Halopiger xanaduensis]|uniref:Uncharacterized protein n=1 Tax=Halopiger xanaduensis (strain DSM 18323 / JCM 14033 / SH-6) TaxID=797210 RepID=F8DB80_HALXS|nr:hypothetical protein [Halopiger xanaduensis]AEH35856.1 hypothetical protein Halxa_1223 [Halopiger xanaduensis SH-6]
MPLVSIVARFRERPLATALEVGSVLLCCLLFVVTFVLLLNEPPAGGERPWLAIVAIGTVFVVFWTALVPLYERFVGFD